MFSVFVVVVSSIVERVIRRVMSQCQKVFLFHLLFVWIERWISPYQSFLQ